MLYIYVIQECASPSEVYSSYLSAATRCQSHISAIAEKGSLSERYCLVLEELRVEALRQTKSTTLGGIVNTQPQDNSSANGTWLQPPVNTTNSSTIPISATRENPPAAADYAATDLRGEPDIDFNGNNIPGFSFPDYSDWDQFTSMVSSGLGNTMGVFTNYDSFAI